MPTSSPARPLVLAVALLGLAVAPVPAGGQDPPVPAPVPESAPPPEPPLAPAPQQRDPAIVEACEERYRCPDLTMRRPYNLRLIRTDGGRRLLASANAIVNVGDGPLELRGSRRTSRGPMDARQVLSPRGSRRPLVLESRGGRIVFFDTKRRGTYWKFEDAARFELWELDDQGHRTRLVRTSPKVYYCFRDLRRVRRLDLRRPYAGSPRKRVFPACSQRGPIREVTLGTSVGWADIYPWHYPQNYISVTGLRGCYAYTQIADPADRFREIREDNNSASVTVRLPWAGGGRRGCPAVRPGEPTRRVSDPAPKDAGEPALTHDEFE